MKLQYIRSRFVLELHDIWKAGYPGLLQAHLSQHSRLRRQHGQTFARPGYLHHPALQTVHLLRNPSAALRITVQEANQHPSWPSRDRLTCSQVEHFAVCLDEEDLHCQDVSLSLHRADNLLAVGMTERVAKLLEGNWNRRRTDELAAPNRLLNLLLAGYGSSVCKQKLKHFARLTFQRHRRASLAKLMLPLMKLKLRKAPDSGRHGDPMT